MLTTAELLSIGRFARLTGLSIKALRHYAEIGLLEPAHVDPATGYRQYDLAQAGRADAVRRLRELELPLDAVREALDGGTEQLGAVLTAHRGRLEERVAQLVATVGELSRLIDGEEELVPNEKAMVRFELSLQDLPPQRLLVVRDRVAPEDLAEVIPRDIKRVGKYLGELGALPPGPPVCICPFPDEEGLTSTATGWPAPEAPARDEIAELVLPATRALVMKHVGPYDLLRRSYRLLEEVIADNDLETTGDPREVYVSDPMVVTNPAEYETLIIWPVRPEDDLKPPRDYFKKRVEID